MESGGSLPRLQERANCPYREIVEFTPCLPSYFCKLHVPVIIPPRSRSCNWSLSARYPHRNPIATSPRACHVFRQSHLQSCLLTRCAVFVSSILEQLPDCALPSCSETSSPYNWHRCSTLLLSRVLCIISCKYCLVPVASIHKPVSKCCIGK
jgi:hypothetical protein